MAALATLSNSESGSGCRTAINAAIDRLNNTAQFTGDYGYAAPASAGDKTTVVPNYTDPNFTTIDSGALNSDYPQTAAALATMASSVVALTSELQAMITAFRSNKVPGGAPPA